MQKIKNNGEVLLSNLLSQYRDSLDQTVLLVCVKLNNYEMFKFLIEKISKKNRKIIINFNHCDSSGWSMLRYSAWIGNEDIVKCCLENGALVDACDNEGRTALRAAVFSGHDNIAKILIKYGANGKFFWFFTRLFLLCKPRECISR
jgi:ankyrin repeat protein